MNYFVLNENEQIFTALTNCQEFERFYDQEPGKSFKRYEMVIRHDGEMKIFEFGRSIARSFSQFVMNGYSPSGKYSIKKTGEGIATRFILIPKHERYIPKTTWSQRLYSRWQGLICRIRNTCSVLRGAPIYKE